MAEDLIHRFRGIPQLYQNLIMGLVAGFSVGFVVMFSFQRFGISGIVLAAFIAFGAGVGYLSGKERERYTRLREEKAMLEEDYEKVQSMLRKSEGKYRLLVENVSDAIYLTTEQGKFLLFNEATCLLSGYSREELRTMTLPQIQLENELTEDHHRAWLDNGICRYEEQWRNRAGQSLHLDINAKWIKIAKVQCVLHVARDVVHRKDAMEEKRVQEIMALSQQRLEDVTNTFHFLNKKFLSPLNSTLDVIARELKKSPLESAKFAPFLSEWEKLQKGLQLITQKYDRSMDPSFSSLNLNDVLLQELFFCALSHGSEELVKRASFASDLPAVFASGRDLSLVLGSLLEAVMKSLSPLDRKNVLVSSRIEENENVVQIQAPGSSDFEYHLAKLLDSTVLQTQGPEWNRGVNAIRLMLKPHYYELQIEHPPGRGVIVRLRIPLMETTSPASQTTRNTGSRDGGKTVLM